MRSLRVKILVWCFAILVFSLIALFAFAPFLAPPQAGPGDLIRATNELQAEGAERAYEEGGQPGLRSYLEKLKRQLAGEYSLFDREGIDLLTGESRTHFLQIARSRGGRLTWVGNDGFVVVAAPSAQRWFAAQHTPPFRPSDQVPYFLMILFAMGVFCWILAVNIAGPLQNMAQVVTRFGAGDLDARIEVRRADEIGKLAESFNQMAGRIQQFLQAEKRLLQDISHELRSPLARLSVAVQLIKRDDQRTGATAQIERETERLGALIGDLVAVTEAEGDPRVSRRELLRADLLVTEIVESCTLEAAAVNCQIRFDNEAGELEIVGVQELLWRAIENVLRNAIRHSPAGSMIETRLRCRGDSEVELEIRDHGPGVPLAQLGHIFEPFYRLDESRNAKTGGVGLGLSIAQRAINLHHGVIAAQNAEPGLRVTIRLPR